jgi:hypothetical protein
MAATASSLTVLIQMAPQASQSVAQGDINGDGIDDLIIGAPYGYSPYSPPGASYVVFGGTAVGTGGSFDLSTLDGSNGFGINSINPGDRLGYSVSRAGDINGDGIDDVIIGAPGTAFSGGGYSTYVVLGSSDVGSGGSLDLSTLDGSNGFVLDGARHTQLAVRETSMAMALMT